MIAALMIVAEKKKKFKEIRKLLERLTISEGKWSLQLLLNTAKVEYI